MGSRQSLRRPFSDARDAASGVLEVVPLDTRRLILSRAIDGYVGLGYFVRKRTDTTAILVRPKRFSLVPFLLFSGFYVVWWLTARDEQVFLSVSRDGRLVTAKA